MNLNRNHWLVLIVFVLIVGNIVGYVWRNWGLITIHSENKTLAEVIRSIEKQGGVTVKTDLDMNVPVRMYVDKVKLTEALETLSTLTESRWRLAYLVAPDKGAIAGALGQFTAGQRVEGWKAISVPMPPMNDDAWILPDPRADAWEVKPPQESKLQAYLQQASRNVSASFIYPTTWNPDVASAPKSGPIAKSLPRLAKAVHGQYEEVFLLQRSGRGGPDREARGADDAEGARPANFDAARNRTGFERERVDRDAVEARIQAEIDRMPPAQRAAAQQERDERRKFFEGMANLTPEQRMAKIQEFMDNPANAERMDKAQAARDARQSPQQKLDRAHKYLENKAQIKSGNAPSGGGGGGARPGPRP